MSTKRPYPESHLSIHHRAPRVATLPDGRIAALSEPGFERSSEARLHLCPGAAAREGLAEPELILVGDERAVFRCEPGARLAAGIWCDRAARLIAAWSDGQKLRVRRTRCAASTVEALAAAREWEPLDPRLADVEGQRHLGSGALDPNGESLWLAAIEQPAGRIMVVEAGGRRPADAVLHAHPLNHSPALAVSPDGRALHVAWDTEDLRILHRGVAVNDVRAGRAPTAEPTEAWWYCHHPDVATNGRDVIVAYSTHMQHVSYGYFDGREWHRNLHLTTLHPRFAETLEHSPWLWTDAHGRVHISFVCLTRRLVYDALWLGEGFADPQPVEGLFHPSLFNDEVRVRAERMSVDRTSGAMLLSSAFLPERHGVYAANYAPAELRPDEPVLFLDLAEVAHMRGLRAEPVTMRHDPAEPILEPTGDPLDFDGARVLNNGTVLRDAGPWRMWYSAVALDTKPQLNWYDQVYVGYAESDDGVNWRRVDTGLGHEFRGRRAPNMIRELDHNACVFIDPDDAPDRRYKAIKFESRAQRYDRVKATGEQGYVGLPRRGWLCTSADGLRWLREEVEVHFPGPEPYGFQPQTALHDPRDPDPNRRYKVIGFTSLVGRRRCATLGYSADCRRWTVAERGPLLDPVAAVTPVRPAGPYAQIHDASIARYGRYLFAFYQNQFDGSTADVRLAVSRDGERFTFVFPEEPLVARGESGAWNSGYVMPVDWHAVGDEMWLYYGVNSDHDRETPGLPEWRVCAGRAVARRDGFVRVSPQNAGQPGQLATIPFMLPDDGSLRLEVNAALGNGAELRVGLAEAAHWGSSIEGFGVADCEPIKGDSVRHHVSWRGRAALPSHVRAVSFRFELRGARQDAIYSFTLRRCEG